MYPYHSPSADTKKDKVEGMSAEWLAQGTHSRSCLCALVRPKWIIISVEYICSYLPDPQAVVIEVLHHNYMNALAYGIREVQYITKRHNFASILSHVGPTRKSCTEITTMPTSSTGRTNNTRNTDLTDVPTEHPPTDSSTEAPNGPSKEPLTVPSTESSTETSKRMTAPVPTARPPCKVAGVHVTSNTGVQNTSPTLTVTWHTLASGAVTYTVKYSTQPREVNTPPQRPLEVTGINGNSTILTALERGTTYYIWVVGVSEGGEEPHSDCRWSNFQELVEWH